MMRHHWISANKNITLSQQCDLVSIPRATHYAKQKPRKIDTDDLLLCTLIDAEYTRHPFYGSRKMVVYLSHCGHCVNRKRVQRLMRMIGLAAMAPKPGSSRSHPLHKVYPYLLRELAIVRPNQVWSTDITYIKLAQGFVYLSAVIDWYSRKILSWRISNSMDATFCVDCLEDALRQHGKPEIFNTDQGSQFTSESFTNVLKRENIQISMDGRGRAFDNIFIERLWRSVKHENVYLMGYSNIPECIKGLTEYFMFYNEKRPHQSLNYKTPNDVYLSATGGGAIIIDKFKRIKKSNEVDLEFIDNRMLESEQCTSAS